MSFRLVRSLYSCRPFASVACLLALSIFLTGCPKDAPQPNSRIGNSERQKTSTAIAPDAIAFNGERAMEHVKKQLAIGPRVAGSPESARTRDYIIAALKSSGLTVRSDEF